MAKPAFSRDSSSFSLFFLVDFLFLSAIFNWVYLRINKFISGSLSFQATSPQKTFSRENKEQEKLTKEELKILMQNLGIICREEDEEEEEEEDNDFEKAFDEEEPSLEEVKQAFDVFDTNRDGFIDSMELRRILCVLGLNDVRSSLERCKEMIKCFDVNNDGRIDFGEFVKLMETTFC